VAERAGRIVAFGEYDQYSEIYHPRKFIVKIVVRADHQRQGLGSALYNQVMNGLTPFNPLSLRVWVREDMTQGLRFFEKRNFREDAKHFESQLEVPTFDFTPYEGFEEKLRTEGIDIKTIKDLEADPNRNRKLYELQVELLNDVPSSERPTAVSYEWFLAKTLNRPNLLPEAYFVALHKGEYVGTSYQFIIKGNNSLLIRITGVKKGFRRLGIALALKLQSIRYAARHGHPVIATWNKSDNEPILVLNERLGFVRQPSWASLVKAL
jgi:GNAT superfamily N-acetyltransferase